MLDQQAQLVPYAAVVPPRGGVHEGGSAEPAFQSGLVDHPTPDVAAGTAALAASGEAPLIQIRRPERLHDAFPGATLERLRELKAVYDPDNVFGQDFPIPPATRASAAAKDRSAGACGGHGGEQPVGLAGGVVVDL